MTEPGAIPEGPLRATRGAEIPDGKRREKMLDRIRLQGFWPLYAAFIVLAMEPPFGEDPPGLAALRVAGLALALLGVTMRVWSLGYLLKKAELATAGPYGLTRNPLYVGTWLIGCGLALNTAFPYNLGLFAVYNVMFTLVYRAQIGIEEEMLHSIYGEPYLEYCRNVPRFFPALRAWRKGDVSRFSLSRAMRNRAWEPLLGLATLLLLQVASWGLLWPVLRGASLADAWRALLEGAWLR